MPANINIRNKLTAVRNIDDNSNYRDRLVKLIPAEIIGAFLAIMGIIPDAAPGAAWISFGVAVILAALITPYLMKFYGVNNLGQIAVTTISFIVWIYSLGQPFEVWQAIFGVQLYVPFLASILLILWTVIVPLFNFPTRQNQAQIVQADTQV